MAQCRGWGDTQKQERAWKTEVPWMNLGPSTTSPRLREADSLLMISGIRLKSNSKPGSSTALVPPQGKMQGCLQSGQTEACKHWKAPG